MPWDFSGHERWHRSGDDNVDLHVEYVPLLRAHPAAYRSQHLDDVRAYGRADHLATETPNKFAQL